MPDPKDPVAEAWEEGRRAHPAVPLPEEAFRTAFVRCRPPRSPRLAPGRAADFYLAAACSAGVDEAWTALRTRWFPIAGAYLLRRGTAPAEVEPLLAELPGHLFEVPVDGEGAGIPRIGSYRGDSALFTWLVVVALRFQRRRNGATARETDLREPETVPEPGAASPAEQVLLRERAKRFQKSIAAAWGTLTRREALAILLKYRDGLPQKEIAGLLGVGEPRVSRLLDSGMARIRREVQHRMRETPPLMGRGDDLLQKEFSDSLAKEMARMRPDGL